MPVFSQACALCNTLDSPQPLRAAVKIFSQSLEAVRCHIEATSTAYDVASHHGPAALGSPMGGLFQCFSPCHPKSSSPTSSIVVFFRDLVCQSPHLQVALQKWCDCHLILTWYQMSTSHIIRFVRDLCSEAQSWLDQQMSNSVPSFLEVKWAQMLSRALGITTQHTPLVLASTLLSADPKLPLARLLMPCPSIVLPNYSPLTESWSVDWSTVRQCMRRLLSNKHQGRTYLMLPDTLSTKRHEAIATLLKLGITRLGSSFPVSVTMTGPGCHCNLWVVHKMPLERSWLSTVFYTTRSLCHLSGAVLDPALFSPLFTHPSVHQPACPETHHRTPTFSEIWKREVEKRRTALAPRYAAWLPPKPGQQSSRHGTV